MKKLLVIVALTAIATSAMAQGKVQFSNLTATTAANGLLSVGTGGSLTAGLMPSLAAYPSGFYVAFFAGATGTSAEQLVLMKSTMNHATLAGKFASGTVDFGTAANPDGSAKAYAVRAWSANWGSDWNAVKAIVAHNTTADGYYGSSVIGTITPGIPPATAPGIFGTAPKVQGFTLDFVPMVPEPASASLIGLGLAGLLIFRRRK